MLAQGKVRNRLTIHSYLNHLSFLLNCNFYSNSRFDKIRGVFFVHFASFEGMTEVCSIFLLTKLGSDG